MILFCKVSLQWWFSELHLGLPCVLKTDMWVLLGQLGLSLTFSEWVQLIPFLRLDMVDNILWDALFCPRLANQIWYPTKKLLGELIGELIRWSFWKKSSKLPYCQKQNFHLGLNSWDDLDCKRCEMPLLLPGIKQIWEGSSCPFMQAKRRKIWS